MLTIQVGLDIIKKKVSQSIIVSRVFLGYQLANLISYELPNVIEQQQFDNAMFIVISDLLGMFVKDPQIEIKEAEYRNPMIPLLDL